MCAPGQAEVNCGLAEQLAFARETLEVAEQLAAARGAEAKELRRRLAAADAARAAAEQRVADGELVRRKLHNTILVRCSQTRPAAAAAAVSVLCACLFGDLTTAKRGYRRVYGRVWLVECMLGMLESCRGSEEEVKYPLGMLSIATGSGFRYVCFSSGCPLLRVRWLICASLSV